MPKSQAPLKTFMEVTYVCYTAYCGYFLAAGFAHIMFYFIFSQLPYCTLWSAYLGKQETQESSARAMHYIALPFHTGTSTHPRKWFGNSYTLLSDTFMAAFLPNNCHQPSTSSNAASCITNRNHSTRWYCSLEESTLEQNRYFYSLGGLDLSRTSVMKLIAREILPHANELKCVQTEYFRNNHLISCITAFLFCFLGNKSNMYNTEKFTRKLTWRTLGKHSLSSNWCKSPRGNTSKFCR